MNASARPMAAIPAAGAALLARTTLWPAALLLALSGVASLIFQILWIKQLSLIVGVEVHAIAAAVGAFFLGLAAGSWVLGRRADRSARPFLMYAGIEAAIAALGVGVTITLGMGAPAFAHVEAFSPLLAWVAVVFVVGITPFFMGGTLPVLLRATGAGRISRAGATLYAANTGGAIVGALLPAFFLIPAMGVQGASWAAAGLNLLAALGACALHRKAPLPAADAAPPVVSAPAPAMPRDARVALGLYAVAGAVAMGYEVLWSQMAVPFMSTRAFAFSIVLAVYLVGLAAGSALYARCERWVGDPWRVFGLLVAGAGLIALVELALLGRWLVSAQSVAESTVLRWTESNMAGMAARFAVAASAGPLADAAAGRGISRRVAHCRARRTPRAGRGGGTGLEHAGRHRGHGIDRVSAAALPGHRAQSGAADGRCLLRRRHGDMACAILVADGKGPERGIRGRRHDPGRGDAG